MFEPKHTKMLYLFKLGQYVIKCKGRIKKNVQHLGFNYSIGGPIKTGLLVHSEGPATCSSTRVRIGFPYSVVVDFFFAWLTDTHGTVDPTKATWMIYNGQVRPHT